MRARVRVRVGVRVRVRVGVSVIRVRVRGQLVARPFQGLVDGDKAGVDVVGRAW